MFNLFVKIFLFLQLLQSIDSFDQSIDLNNDDHHRNDLFQMKSFWIKSMIDSDDKIFALESNSIQDNRIDKNVWKYHNQMDSYASFDLPKLINRFRLISLKPLLIEEDFQPKFNFDKSFIRNLEQSRWIRIKNGQLFVLINNQMLPIETVLESIQRNNRQQYRSQSFLMNREDFRSIRFSIQRSRSANNIIVDDYLNSTESKATDTIASISIIYT
ncbi:hypothetical protein SSS_07318 [Sarcoptes scabiei]|uniref:Uncharacterized protein n=1 Tax=Sarcoptes scabiei TaxID=52283 RepID=A0A834V8R3_SARSC|nr:hypothetical protein SSS_07318 [Sarcoptes scabiei]